MIVILGLSGIILGLVLTFLVAALQLLGLVLPAGIASAVRLLVRVVDVSRLVDREVGRCSSILPALMVQVVVIRVIPATFIAAAQIVRGLETTASLAVDLVEVMGKVVEGTSRVLRVVVESMVLDVWLKILEEEVDAGVVTV